eukprot:203237-Hanusia_phi.AAC.1
MNLCGHKCKDWEVFDMDLAGCMDCGHIHQCVDEFSCNLSEVNDSRVCVITGCYVKQKVYRMDEFMDNMMMEDDSVSSRVRGNEIYSLHTNSSSMEDHLYKVEDVNKCLQWIMSSE